MKAERLFRIICLVEDDLIEEVPASFSHTPKKRSHWRPILAAAACLGVVCTLSFTLYMSDRGGSKDATADSPSESDGSGIAHDTEPLSVEGTTFMSYAGPVFPLTLLEDTEGLTVERRTTWDFTPGTTDSETTRQWGTTVSDSYVLMNHTTGEIVAMASYPVADSFEGLAEHTPTITVDGAETDWSLSFGSYAGGFTNAGVDDGSTWNLESPDSWTDYKTLLEDGTYQAGAFSETPTLTDTVTVYSFTDFKAPEQYDAATQAISFDIDKEKTTVLSYGFNGMSWDENGGWRQYSYFVPDAAGGRKGMETRTKTLIVLGEDIGTYTLQGYENGGCDKGEELDGVSCTVTRYETTLGAVLKELCASYMAEFETDLFANPFELLSLEQYTRAVQQQLTEHGILAEDAMKDRYADGRLSEMLYETLHYDRVLYLTFPVTIPAGGSVTVTAELWKEPSFDFGCSGSEHVGLQGYDFVTTLGSNLEFTAQTAALTNTENIEIYQQSFGFDLETGVTEVLLDPNQEHYYLEIRPRE